MIAQLKIDFEHGSRKFTFVEVNLPKGYLIRCSICEGDIMNTPQRNAYESIKHMSKLL